MNLVHEGVLPPNEPDDRDERREEMEMAQKRETVADIVAELRNKTGNMYDCTITTDEEEFHSYADRIEEAWEREREELDKRISDLEAYAKLWTGRADELRLKCDEFYAKAKPVGNAAAMREALLRCEAISCLPEIREQQCVRDMRNIIAAALSAPTRNCDVGTAEEQGERCMAEFDQWRRKGDNRMLITAIMEWAQTPYEAQEGGAQ